MKDVWYYDALCCPNCHGDIEISKSISCKQCGYKSKSDKDLRPTHKVSKAFMLEYDPGFNPEKMLNNISMQRPVNTYDGPNAQRNSSEFMTEISNRVLKGGKVLDLGCGTRDQFVPLNYLGYSYVGVDYTSENADFLADAHCLPFIEETFHCVLSYAVLEHLSNPFMAITEIERVLKPGGIFIGSVSFGEPFHSSYFHHSSWGLLSLVSTTKSLQVSKMWSSMGSLRALSRLGRYSKVIKKH
ncbi:class I SAM-dependent methyltransferase [bacterium]|nr:MAG: class I SAM-dependent methyltransferase [bacterium]